MYACVRLLNLQMQFRTINIVFFIVTIHDTYTPNIIMISVPNARCLYLTWYDLIPLFFFFFILIFNTFDGVLVRIIYNQSYKDTF